MRTGRRLTRTMAAALPLVASLLLIGCSKDVDGEPATTGAVAVDNMPAEQREAFADGAVDSGEYEAGFSRFRDCANGIAPVVVNIQVDPATGLIGYGVVGALSAPGGSNGSDLDECYQRFFSFIEAEWQTTDPGMLDDTIQRNLEIFHSMVQPCLEANGIAVPTVVVPGTDEFGDLTRQFTDLNDAGLCDPK